MCGLYNILVYPSKDCVVSDGGPARPLFRIDDRDRLASRITRDHGCRFNDQAFLSCPPNVAPLRAWKFQLPFRRGKASSTLTAR